MITIPLRTWPRRVAWLALVLLLLLVAAWTVLNVIGSSRWEATLRELRGAGFSTTLTELQPPPVAASENSAPYYTAAFGLHVAEGPESPFDKGVRAMSEEERKRLREWLARNQESFEMVARARKRPACRFDHDYSQGYAMLLPELSPTLQVATALQLRAQVQALDGDAAGARESIRSIFALADTLKTEPVLIVQLVRSNLVTRALEGLAACVAGQTGEAEIQEWLAMIPDPEVAFAGSVQLAFRGEMAMVSDLLSRPSPDILGMEVAQLQGPLGLFRPWLLSDGSRYMSIMRRAVKASARPYPEARRELDELNHVIKASSSWTNPVCSLLLPAIFRCMDVLTAARARLAVARAGLAAAGHPAAPVTEINPFTGKPLTVDVATGKIVCDGVPEGQGPIVWDLASKK